MKSAILFVTGSDTGVGKTVLATLLTRHLLEQGFRVAGLKPICSGGRGDALALREAAGRILTLDEVNPWHFRAPLAPLLAARRDQRKVRLGQVLAHVRRMQRRFPVLIVEGAGGLLSPLGEDFDARDLIRELRAAPIVACPNRLGAINQARLVLAALPPGLAGRAHVVLMSTRPPDAAARTNRHLLGELFGPARVHVLPWLKFADRPARALADRTVRRTLRSLAGTR